MRIRRRWVPVGPARVSGAKGLGWRSLGWAIGVALGGWIAATPAGAAVVINEILAFNERGRRDEDRERHDWIELYNAGDEIVSLEGYSLSDDPDWPDS